MVKRIITTIIITLSIFISTIATVKAEELLSISTDEIIVNETDLGRTYSIELTNKSDKDIFIKAEEIVVERSKTGDFVKKDVATTNPNDQETTKSLEIFQTSFKIKPGEKIEHKVRIKFWQSNLLCNRIMNYIIFKKAEVYTSQNMLYFCLPSLLFITQL